MEYSASDTVEDLHEFGDLEYDPEEDYSEEDTDITDEVEEELASGEEADDDGSEEVDGEEENEEDVAEEAEDPLAIKQKQIESELNEIKRQRKAEEEAAQQRQAHESQQIEAKKFEELMQAEDKKFLDTFKSELATKGDAAALLTFKRYADSVFQYIPQIVDQQVQQALQTVAQHAQGKRAFLADQSVADVHPHVDKIADLVSRGYSTEQAVTMVRDIMGSGQSSSTQKKTQARKLKAVRQTRKRTHLEDTGGTGASRGRKASKSAEDREIDGYVKQLFSDL